jgi:microcompartment protein CcmL/EutN|tara:strand:- start:86 stop:436 length:351 start_codon:yes stop_codon:yes gene_type:complete
MRVLNSTLSPSPQLGKGIVGDALGMIETRGLVAAIEAGDAMVKAAEVEMMGWQIVGGGLVTTLVRGDVAAVRAATEAGELAARAVGEVVAVHVIARPHTSLLDLLPTTGLSRILAS